MDQEQAFMPEVQEWTSKFVDQEDETKQTYQYFMRPEPFEDLGPIEHIDDPFTGRTMKVRTMKVGMVRNATAKQEKLVFLDPFPHIRLEKGKDLQGWYKAKHVGPQERPRPCYTEAILTEPYGGYCSVGCAFCYVNSGIRGYRGSGLITVPINYGEHVRRQLATMKTSAAGYFSSFTDPFLDLEDIYHNSQRGAEAFAHQGLPVFFLSRKRYPEWAVQLLQENKYSYAQKSINTCDPTDWRLLSPGAIPLLDNMADIRRLRDAGIYVSIQCNPIIPGVVSHDHILKLFEMLAEAGANHVIVKFVEAGYSWAPAMVDRIKRRFGAERGGLFERLFTDNMGGQRVVQEQYRLEGHRLYAAQAKKVGLTYATCYEYGYQYNPDGSKVNSIGVNLAPQFMTSDQCHGQKVPMFSREGTSLPFTEVADCPPSGCLTCADETGQSKCGSPWLGDAGALRMVDLKRSYRDVP